MAVVLGLLAATVWGAADFLGGFASRRSTTGAVVFVSQLAGLVAVPIAVVAVPGEVVGRDLALGAGAAVVGVGAIALLYRGLAVGRMGLVAPLSALVAAGLPVIWGVARGERPSPAASVGIAIAIVAVVLVARERPDPDEIPGDVGAAPTTRAALLGVGAGAGFGFTFILFSEVGDASGMWPIFAGQIAATTVAGLVVAAARRPLLPHRADAPAAAWAGIFNLSALAFFVLAAREGLTSIVAPVASLYPAGTVVLARVVLAERMQRHQVVGLGLALVGLVLLGAG